MDDKTAGNASRSYYNKPQCFPYSYQTLPECLDKWANIQPDREAVVIRVPDMPRKQLTFSQLRDQATRFAKGLLQAGLEKGDKVALYVRNSLEWMVGFCGIVAAGGIALMATSFHVGNCVQFASEMGCSAMILDVRNITNTEELVSLERALITLNNNSKLHAKSSIILVQGRTKSKCFNDFHDLLKEADDSAAGHVILPTLDPDDYFSMFPTSGSTGKSKYIFHSHFSAINGFLNTGKQIGISNDDIFFSDRAMGYFGGFITFMFPLGCTLVNTFSETNPSRKNADFILDILAEEKVTSAYFPPYLLFDLMASSRPPGDTPKIRMAFVAGQVVQPAMYEGLASFAQNPICLYGMSEMYSYFAMKLPDFKPGEKLSFYPGDDIEVKIVNDSGDVVPFGVEGEICVRSPSCTRAYYGDDVPPARDPKLWYSTGDMASLTSSGRVVVSGRKKEVIKRATVKIHPAAIETVLGEHPLIEEVFVVGIPDERVFEEVCACIVKKGEEELSPATIQRFAEDIFQPSSTPDGRGLMPKHFFIMEDIPRLATGKVDRLGLKQRCIQLTSSDR